MDDVARGLWTALVLLAVAAAVALAAAGIWLAVQGGEFRTKVALSLIVVAALISLTGGTTFTRAADNDTRAFLGWGPDREEPGSGSALTALGVFLFVSLPLFIGGLVLFGSG
ncbi:hypothetical protein [Geodermatophilus sp. DSM 45219]|uniref:hypothetical protein n=1 Tax=Geodermatophilus sp. DSM 45219 TaxID=1881103 RepID=UPI0008818800|nr:hypothetical protein [Geodermatophilus sp. DSM 45219]SDN96330.1 hypothetical protein SAMN05428965_2125 [Geodermatophilus sp. DSM 45219]